MTVDDHQDVSDVCAPEEWLALREASDRAEGVLIEVVLQSQVDGHSTEEPAVAVPRSAWEKMLEQLGNLHEAGGRLAEATERAVRAEERYAFELERRKLLEDRVAQLEMAALLPLVDGGVLVGETVFELDAVVDGVVGVEPAAPPPPSEEPDAQPIVGGASTEQPFFQQNIDPDIAKESVFGPDAVEDQEPVTEGDERDLFAFEAYRRQLLEERPELKSAEHIPPATPRWQRGVHSLQEWIRRGREESYFLEEVDDETN
ncbi:MAG: hypothetical protein P1T08_18270 [Acidimicrobiia bacterium]|nr:hypothetical protein [Acidimicrobiia bacterium]